MPFVPPFDGQIVPFELAAAGSWLLESFHRQPVKL